MKIGPDEVKKTLPYIQNGFLLCLTAAGVGICIYTILSINPTACPFNSDCHNVTGSEYSKIGDIPIQIFGLLLWTALCSNNRYAYIVAAIGLVTGSAYLTLLQVFVIKKVCSLCIAHAFLAITASIFRNQAKHLQLAFPIGTITSIAIIIITQNSSSVPAATKRETSSTIDPTIQSLPASPSPNISRPSAFAFKRIPNFDKFDAFNWIGDTNSDSAVIAISATCSHCIDLLEKILDRKIDGRIKNAPKIMIYAGPTNMRMNVLFAELFEAKEAGTIHHLSKVLTIIKKHRHDIIRNKTSEIKAAFVHFPKISEHEKRQLEERIRNQSNLLLEAKVGGTPFFINKSGFGGNLIDWSQL